MKSINTITSQTRKVSLILQCAWLLIVIASFCTTLYNEKNISKHIAIAEAETIFKRDQLFRFWSTSHGGVYVPSTKDTPPNPYLKHVPFRDIKRPDGLSLTLMNPAYMIRQMNEQFSTSEEPSGHITSLKPLRPENNADQWETKALLAFEQGKREVMEFTEINGQPYLRFMQPMITREGCLKCHGHQGYRAGDIRGGISVSLPMKNLLEHSQKAGRFLALWHILVYLAGFFIIFWGRSVVTRKISERDRALSALQESEEKFRTFAEFTYAWEYWIAPDGSMKYVSPSVERLTGYQVDRFIQDPTFIKNLVVEEDQQKIHDHLINEVTDEVCEFDFRIRTKAGEERWLHHICQPVYDSKGNFLGRRASNYDVTEKKKAWDQVNTLRGFIPICASCKKIRDDQGFWNQMEVYISQHSEAEFSHSICPDCSKKLYPEFQPDEE
ncbi:MAG: DUF3365 domain-containing protein [Thermodesulfobacteriota bacterium]